MRRSALVFCFLGLILAAECRTAIAQVEPAGYGRQFRLSAGGFASGFSPQDANQPNYFSTGSQLIGAGAVVDVHFTHWMQLEAEGRWMRWHGYGGETQDNYLIGPRVPVLRVGSRGQLYGKGLVGLGKMTFPLDYGYGSFTAIAFGATLEYRLTRKLTLRPADFEYQYWPNWLAKNSLHPFGVSIGATYRVF
ncbi:MAG TPA: hypothetical protein VKB38_24785 [Terracidiphilus sp.]|nr:hypothetical protein [Terracidiphilus sp.]